MEFMDIHICGACRTQFNNVEHFIAHKQICPILNKLKRQNNKPDNQDTQNNQLDSSGKSTVNDLSRLLSRGTSVNLQTLSSPAVSVHNTNPITPLHSSIQDSTVILQAYNLSKSEETCSLKSVPENKTTIASFQSTFSRERKLGVSSEDHGSSAMQQPVFEEQRPSEYYSGTVESGSIELSQENTYISDKSQAPRSVTHSYMSQERNIREADDDLPLADRHYQGDFMTSSQEVDRSRQPIDNFYEDSQKQINYTSEYADANSLESDERHSFRSAHIVIQPTQVDQNHMTVQTSFNSEEPSLVYQHQPIELTAPIGYVNQSEAYAVESSQNKSQHKHVLGNQINQDTDIPHEAYQQKLQVQQQFISQAPDDAQQGIEASSTLSHHNYYTPSQIDSSYTPLENVQFDKPSSNFDHQYLCTNEPDIINPHPKQVASGKKTRGASNSGSPKKRLRQSNSKSSASTTKLDLLHQALQSENVNLHPSNLNDSTVDPGAPYPMQTSGNVSVLATTLQEHTDPVYSSTLHQPDSSILTDVEMVPACNIDQVDAEPNQAPIVSTAPPQYIVVKAKKEKGSKMVRTDKNKVNYCEYDNCNYKTSYSKDMERHQRIHTGVKPYACENCDRRFARSDKLKVHNRSHTGEKPFQCTTCEYATVDSSSLKKHIRTHTDERPFKCQLCSYASKNSSQLVVHLRTHTGDSPFQCNMCNAKFKINSDLYRHRRIHTGEKPFKCELCDYRCSVKGNLKTHMKINHSEENKMTCDSCEFSSSSRKTMREHYKIHELAVRLECSQCSYICNSKSAMAIHGRVHSEERPYSCDFCSYKSKQIGNIKSHIKHKHFDELKTSKYFARSEKSEKSVYNSPEKSESQSPSKALSREAYKCNICAASFVRMDSLRSHTRQHCRDIAENLESTAMAVLQLQNSSPKKSGSELNRSNKYKTVDSNSPSRDKSTRSTPRKLTRASQTTNNPHSGLQDIVEAAKKLHQIPDAPLKIENMENSCQSVPNTSVISEQFSTDSSVQHLTIAKPVGLEHINHVIQSIPEEHNAGGNELDRLQQTHQDTICSVDGQNIIVNSSGQQLIELPSGQLVSLKPDQGATNVTANQVQGQQITQYQVIQQPAQQQQYAVQLVPQQSIQQQIPLNLLTRDINGAITVQQNPQIQIVVPSQFYNQTTGLNSAVASNHPQIVIQLQDPNTASQLKSDSVMAFPSSGAQTYVTAYHPNQLGPHRLLQDPNCSTVISDNRMMVPQGLQVQEVVVQMEVPTDNLQTKECQSEAN